MPIKAPKDRLAGFYAKYGIDYEYRRRVIPLGEQPEHVLNVAGLGVDNILRLKLIARHELEEALNFKP